MSQKTRSIADVLKTGPSRRSNNNSVVSSNNANNNVLSETDSKIDEVSNTRNDSKYELSEPLESSEQKSSNHEDEYEDEYNQHYSTQASKSAPGEDLVSRLTRLHGSENEENDNHLKTNEETHRATSRQRQRRGDTLYNKQYETSMRTSKHSEDENEYSDNEENDDVRGRGRKNQSSGSNKSNNRRNMSYSNRSQEAPPRTSRRSGGYFEQNDRVNDERATRSERSRDEERITTSRSNRRNYDHHRQESSFRPITSRDRRQTNQISQRVNSTRNNDHHNTSKSVQHRRESFEDEKERNYNSKPRGYSKQNSYPEFDEEYFDRHSDKRGTSLKTDRSNYPDDRSDRSDRSNHSDDEENEASFSFTTLPKTTITRIAKAVNVPSLAADVYDTVKSLAGNFTYNVLADAAKNGEIVSSNELEPITEEWLGRPVEDLDQTFINSTTFVKFIRPITDELRIKLRNEATLFLQNTVEFYIVNLLSNARDVAEQARRSRITNKDLMLASRMA